MKRSLTILLIIAAAVAAAFLGHKVYHRSQLRGSFGRGADSGQFGDGEGNIPQSGDLCGGTGGNGEIINVESNAFTLKLNNGSNRLIHLAGNASIKTSTGTVSVSDLKTGDRVTLVGGPNPDGSFTANTVVVCAGTGQATQSGQQDNL
ncbi:MAG: hypothetical protein KGH79_01915 [Patescibacteria group bacterium]|nr:hypothetical protein [Patescibacteria group bacterium]